MEGGQRGGEDPAVGPKEQGVRQVPLFTTWVARTCHLTSLTLSFLLYKLKWDAGWLVGGLKKDPCEALHARRIKHLINDGFAYCGSFKIK